VSKGPLALRTISETADALGVQQHVLRFWESKFAFIRPTKRAGGRRFYRPQDIQILEGVKTLLYDRGYTIRGVQMLFKEQGQKAILGANTMPLATTGDQVVFIPSESTGEDGDTMVIQRMSDETRQRFLDVARALEDAQAALGRSIDRIRSSDLNQRSY
jgi:DNA-binding transcriptional MerR regulator